MRKPGFDSQLKPWFVYVLRCSDGSLYTGITTDVERRLDQHNGQTAGGAKYTRPRRPVHLAMTPIRTLGQWRAARLESYIKSLPKARKERFVEVFDARVGEVYTNSIITTGPAPQGKWTGVLIDYKHMLLVVRDEPDPVVSLWGVYTLLGEDGAQMTSTLGLVRPLRVDMSELTEFYYEIIDWVDVFNVGPA